MEPEPAPWRKRPNLLTRMTAQRLCRGHRGRGKALEAEAAQNETNE